MGKLRTPRDENGHERQRGRTFREGDGLLGPLRAARYRTEQSVPFAAIFERGRLWEMRLNGRTGTARALYVAAAGRRVVIVRVFTKKTEKTPRREIDMALSRAKLVR